MSAFNTCIQLVSVVLPIEYQTQNINHVNKHQTRYTFKIRMRLPNHYSHKSCCTSHSSEWQQLCPHGNIWMCMTLIYSSCTMYHTPTGITYPADLVVVHHYSLTICSLSTNYLVTSSSVSLSSVHEIVKVSVFQRRPSNLSKLFLW